MTCLFVYLRETSLYLVGVQCQTAGYKSRAWSLDRGSSLALPDLQQKSEQHLCASGLSLQQEVHLKGNFEGH